MERKDDDQSLASPYRDFLMQIRQRKNQLKQELGNLEKEESVEDKKTRMQSNFMDRFNSIRSASKNVKQAQDVDEQKQKQLDSFKELENQYRKSQNTEQVQSQLRQNLRESLKRKVTPPSKKLPNTIGSTPPKRSSSRRSSWSPKSGEKKSEGRKRGSTEAHVQPDTALENQQDEESVSRKLDLSMDTIDIEDSSEEEKDEEDQLEIEDLEDVQKDPKEEVENYEEEKYDAPEAFNHEEEKDHEDANQEYLVHEEPEEVVHEKDDAEQDIEEIPLVESAPQSRAESPEMGALDEEFEKTEHRTIELNMSLASIIDDEREELDNTITPSKVIRVSLDDEEASSQPKNDYANTIWNNMRQLYHNIDRMIQKYSNSTILTFY
jgi:hypothetical protein